MKNAPADTNRRDPVAEGIELIQAFGPATSRVEALRGVTLELGHGEFVSVMGPSGSGKSTLLHLLGGLALPSSGIVRVEGQDLAQLDDDALTLLRRRRIGFIFQAFNLLPSLTALENVALPLTIDGVRERDAQQRARETLDHVGLMDRGDHLPGELSGGEQQRVAIARAIVGDPVLVLADEPTGNLDSAAGERVVELLRGLVNDRGHTILMVTHDTRCAAVADRMLRLKDGRLVETHQSGPARDARTVLDDLDQERR